MVVLTTYENIWGTLKRKQDQTKIFLLFFIFCLMPILLQKTKQIKTETIHLKKKILKTKQKHLIILKNDS